MYLIKQNKKLISYILIMVYTFILNFSIFLFSEAFISQDNFSIKSANSLVTFPKPLYIELLSISVLLPEEELLTVSEFMNSRIHYINSYRYHKSNISLTSFDNVKMFICKLINIFTRSSNTSTSNAIPLGGHAPPIQLGSFKP